MNKEKEEKLILIPKTEKYIEYMINLIIKLPRTENFSIGTEYKTSMYKMLENILFISNIDDKKKCIEILNNIDAMLNTQRIFLRIMYKNKWIDNKKFNIYNGIINYFGDVP